MKMKKVPLWHVYEVNGLEEEPLREDFVHTKEDAKALLELWANEKYLNRWGWDFGIVGHDWEHIYCFGIKATFNTGSSLRLFVASLEEAWAETV